MIENRKCMIIGNVGVLLFFTIIICTDLCQCYHSSKSMMSSGSVTKHRDEDSLTESQRKQITGQYTCNRKW